MASYRKPTPRLNAQQVINILDSIDPNDSDIDAASTDEDPILSDADEVLQEFEQVDSSSDEQEPEPSTSSTKVLKKKSYFWTRQNFDPPETEFTGQLYTLPQDYEMPSPLHFFREFFTDDMVEELVANTNLYSVQKNNKCTNTNKKEVETFIGMFFRMGLARMAGTRCYWETDTRYSPVADVMSRNRFQLLLSTIHLVDNQQVSEEEKTDKLWKINPWLQKLRRNCLKVVPEEHNSIDEMMIPFKGKFSKIKQYIKGKPHPWGIKVWARTTPSGCLCDFEVYQGNRDRKEKSHLGVGADVVLRLCESLPSNIPGEQPFNYKITADNFFSGLPLVTSLQSVGLHYTGTVRPNRLPGSKLQTENEMKKKGRGSIDYNVERTSNIVAVRWFDTRAVTTISTYAGTEPINKVKRYDKSKKQYVQVDCPSVIKLYNEKMGGVDLLDCFLSKHTLRIRAKRWYIYIFWHTIRLMLVNAWLSYRRACTFLGMRKKDILNQRHFQAKVATLLIELHGQKRGRPSILAAEPVPKKRKHPQQVPDVAIRTDGYFHFPIKDEHRQRCKCCQQKTNTVCEKCFVHLCFTEQRNCFKAFHLN